MSKFDQNIELYKKAFEKQLKRKDYNEELLRKIARSLGPQIYRNDSSKVACSDKAERNRIKKSFLIKKLGLKDDPKLDTAIEETCKAMGNKIRNKYRVVFYYLLVEKYNKESLYLTPKSFEEDVTNESTTSSHSTKSKTKEKMSEEKSKSPQTIVKNHAMYAAGVGFIPIPLIDLVSISAVQFSMIKNLAGEFPHVTFDEEKAKSLIAALVGGVGSFQLGTIARFMFKGLPGIGTLIGGTAISGFAYISTKVMGEIFIEHFASGGDLSVEELTSRKFKETFNLEMKKWKKA